MKHWMDKNWKTVSKVSIAFALGMLAGEIMLTAIVQYHIYEIAGCIVIFK